jgi:hypothetical protein
MLQRLLLAVVTAGLGLAGWADSAEAQYFGRNKVQHRAFDFKVIETAHFDIYFYEDARDAALDAARMAERSYARLSRVLQHEFRDRKAIIIYASHTEFQQTNVYPTFVDEGTQAFAEPIRDRIVIPFTGSYADFEHVHKAGQLVAEKGDQLMFRGKDSARVFNDLAYALAVLAIHQGQVGGCLKFLGRRWSFQQRREVAP